MSAVDPEAESRRRRRRRWQTRASGLGLTVLAASAVAAAVAAGSPFGAPPVRRGSGNAGASILALRGVRLGQRGTQIELQIDTRGSWSAHDIDDRLGRSLCLVLFYGAPARARSRVCVTAAHGAAALNEVALDGNGAPVGKPEPVGA